MDDSCFYGENTSFLEKKYQAYLNDPNSIDSSWHEIFMQIEQEVSSKKAIFTQDGLTIAVMNLIDNYRRNGHFISTVNPLKDHSKERFLDHNIDDIKQKVNLCGELKLDSASVEEVISIMKKAHCENLGLEFMHMTSDEEKKWLQEQIENRDWRAEFTHEQKKRIFQDVMEAELFENYLHTKFPGAKRFSIEGGESAIASLEAIISHSVNFGAEEVLIGMAHRGRLNVLTKVMKKNYAAMFYEFQGGVAHPQEYEGAGDVKYHLGASCDRVIKNNAKIHLSLAANPSHLEAVNPVVMGKVRCKQDLLKDHNKTKAFGVLIHGDAAFTGQGVVHECFNLNGVKNYNTGGLVHILVNNQIGFTTNQEDARGFFYPAYAGVAYDVPIFHINGDDPEAVVFSSLLAVEYRYKFKNDALLGMQCYRKYGHNEGDEPRFTQPNMYANISARKSPMTKYAEQLISEGVFTSAEIEKVKNAFKEHLDRQFEEAKNYKPNPNIYYCGNWANFKKPKIGTRHNNITGPSKKYLKELAQNLSVVPDHIAVHDKVQKLLLARLKAVQEEKGIDWGNAEHLAFASLLSKNYNIRLAGQDSRRGTFSHRHAMIVDQKNEERYIPLNNIANTQGRFEVLDTTLSEYAAMGFEYGYSLVNPNNLVLWEGQFGDFANGAQIIIDQFLASGESKWLQSSGLVLLLPHGYEGQGPEHSSARIERFLQLCAEDNMQVVNCSTPANYFHVLRRQMLNDFRKPLIVFTPKSLLRHKHALSSLDDLSDKSAFQEVIGDHRGLHDVKKIIFCSGKVYYDIIEYNIENVAVIRIEQLYPFPSELILEELKKYPSAEIIWCQEEQKNMGAWSFIFQEFYELLGKNIRYVGRKASSSPASGYLSIHNDEKDIFLDELTK